jgi:hypothetical protein
MISVAIIKPVVEHVEFVRSRGEVVLNDKQAALVEHFATTYVKAASHPTFHLALLSKLAGGCCGDAALRRAIVLAALDIGVERETLQRLGLLSRGETMERHRGAKTESDGDDG